jgi:hypothetical protein
MMSGVMMVTAETITPPQSTAAYDMKWYMDDRVPWADSRAELAAMRSGRLDSARSGRLSLPPPDSR